MMTREMLGDLATVVRREAEAKEEPHREYEWDDSEPFVDPAPEELREAGRLHAIADKLRRRAFKPTIPEVIDRFRAYHAMPGNGAWGALHVVLDDNNVADHFVVSCIDSAYTAGDYEGAELAQILARMSRTQRLKLARIA